MTEPLTPSDADLRDFQFMPVDVVRLRDSGIAVEATGEEFRAALMLWCAAWHQVPAGSLPNNDIQLSMLAGYGRVVKEWGKVREGAMRGFILCSDGRFYHPVVAEKVNEAWVSKVKYAEKKEADRARKEALRGTDKQKKSGGQQKYFQRKNENVQRTNDDFQLTNHKSPTENALKGQGQGQGQGNKGEGAQGTRLPPGWILTDDLHHFAIDQGLSHDSIQTEFDKFRDYWNGIPGAKGRKADWSATWRNWIRRKCEGNQPKAANHSNFSANLAALAGSGRA